MKNKKTLLCPDCDGRAHPDRECALCPECGEFRLQDTDYCSTACAEAATTRKEAFLRADERLLKLKSMAILLGALAKECEGVTIAFGKATDQALDPDVLMFGATGWRAATALVHAAAQTVWLAIEEAEPPKPLETPKKRSGRESQLK